MKYKVEIIETLSRLIDVEAETEAEALAEAEIRYDCEVEVLDSSDFRSVDFKIENA